MPHASCSKPPKSTLELEIKCYGEIPPVALSLRSCCLCYRDLSHSVTPVRRPSRTAAASRRPNSPLILSAKDHLVTAEFPQEGFTESILAWADLMLLREIQTTSSQDLREVRFSHYHCFCSQGCVRGGWLWQITCHSTWCDHSLAGNTSFPSHAWSFHETRYHTNQIVVEFFPKLPLSSDVSFLLLTNSASVPLAVAGTQDRPGCQLILYDLFQNSFSTFKIKLCARYSDLIQLLPINQLMVWPCVEVFLLFVFENEHNRGVTFWSDTWSQWKHWLFCAWCICHEGNHYSFRNKLGKKHSIQKKQQQQKNTTKKGKKDYKRYYKSFISFLVTMQCPSFWRKWYNQWSVLLSWEKKRYLH